MSEQGHNRFIDAAIELAQIVKDSDYIIIHNSNCTIEITGECHCDGLTMSGKELKELALNMVAE